jgi:photosystem II stability/assembly factor-like uncharacterized protein
MKKLVMVLLLGVLSIGLAIPLWGAPGSPNTWVHTPTNMTVGSVLGFGFSPDYGVDQTVFAATSNVFKSTDGGLTWGPTTLNKASSSLAFSPNYASDHVLIAGTNQGVWKTISGGTNWTDLSATLPGLAKSILVVAFPPNYPSNPTVFAGTRDAGLYKTTDINTPNWTLAGSGSSINTKKSRITSLAFSPNFAADQVVFAGAYTDQGTDPIKGGIYKSIDGGANWTPINNWNPEPVHRNVNALVISPNYINDHTVFAGLYSGAGVYKSTDGGETWVFLPGTQFLYIQSLAISPNYALDGTVFAGEEGGGCYLTTDGGNSWRAFNTGFNGDKSILSLAIPPTQTSQPFNVFAGMFGDRVWQMLYQNFRLFLPMTIQ